MKKAIVCCLLFIFCCIHSVSARPVSEEKAKRIALNWVLEKWGRQLEISTLKTSALAKVESNNLYYVLSFPQGGWIIVSADDVAYPIIAFSYTGSYSAQEHPIQFDEWMDNVQKEISDAIIQYSLPLPEADIIWQRFNVSTDEFSALKLSEYAVNPLLTTTWNQGTYYNASCPVDANGSGGHVWAGCVATAMAQVMKYHNHPLTGSGSHSYFDNSYGTQSANFGATTYNWDSMPNSLSGHNRAVATLLYHAGVSVEMDYGVDGSSASTRYDTVNALKRYFKYSNDLYYASRSFYSTSDWKALLRTELNNNRPILYRGSGSGGHAFVCDGYSNSDFFHFNWGWGGYYDGYFYLSDLTPDSRNYNHRQGAIFDIEPDRPNIIGPILLLLLGG